MREIFKSIGLLLVLIFFSNFALVLPDFVGGEQTSFGAVGGTLFYVLFSLGPIIAFILLDLGVIDVYALPLSDIFDHCMNFVLYLLVVISSFIFPHTGSAMICAISFIMTAFIMLFPLHLFYTDIVKFILKVENRFLYNLSPIVLGGIIVFSIVFAYAFGPQEIYLPGDLLLSCGTYTIMDIAVPNLCILSALGFAVFLVYDFTVSRWITKLIENYKYNSRGNGRSRKYR